MDDTALYRVTNGGGGGRDIMCPEAGQSAHQLASGNMMSPGGTETVTFTRDSYNIRYRGHQVQVCGEVEGGRVVVEESCWFHLCLADIWVNKCKAPTMRTSKPTTTGIFIPTGSPLSLASSTQ